MNFCKTDDTLPYLSHRKDEERTKTNYSLAAHDLRGVPNSFIEAHVCCTNSYTDNVIDIDAGTGLLIQIWE